MRIGIVAGEASGDLLGAGLMHALRAHFAEAGFVGVGGPAMIAEGFQSLADIERLSVMGLVEPLKRLPELLRLRRRLVREFSRQQVDLVVGIDSPDFTLGLERRLKSRGIPAVHYVSPSVWAWRQSRLKGIARSVDLMLTLFPFEAEFYRRAGIPVEFVGHPLADQFADEPDTGAARAALSLDRAGSPLVALLPGSRRGEVELIAPLLLGAAEQLVQRYPDAHFVLPAAGAKRYRELEPLVERCAAPVRLLHGESRRAMESADVVLLASGTSTLEAMFLKRPMVVVYRLGGMTYRIVRHLVKTPFIALPNLLAGELLVDELVQDDATVQNVVTAASALIDDPMRRERQRKRFAQLHDELRLDASERAAAAIERLLSGRGRA